jgi:low affinity Fe/Cu permease
MAPHRLRLLLTRIGTATASPVAFAIVGVYALLWLVFERSTFDWHAVATLATWFMTLFIQRAEHRDTQAIHAKLDELLLSHGEARTELRAIDDDEPEEIERHRAEVRQGQGSSAPLAPVRPS